MPSPEIEHPELQQPLQITFVTMLLGGATNSELAQGQLKIWTGQIFHDMQNGGQKLKFD